MPKKRAEVNVDSHVRNGAVTAPTKFVMNELIAASMHTGGLVRGVTSKFDFSLLAGINVVNTQAVANVILSKECLRQIERVKDGLKTSDDPMSIESLANARAAEGMLIDMALKAMPMPTASWVEDGASLYFHGEGYHLNMEIVDGSVVFGIVDTISGQETSGEIETDSPAVPIGLLTRILTKFAKNDRHIDTKRLKAI